jgi:hypothetical protein
VAEGRVDDLGKCPPPGGRVGAGHGEPVGHGRDGVQGPADHHPGDVVLAVKVVVHGSLGDTEPVGDVAQ